MARIRRAQAKGKKDVKLTKEELAAYQRRLQRMEDEERRRRREQRVAIPISELDPASLRTRLSVDDDRPQRNPSPEQGVDRHVAYPPMGYFPPQPSRSRPRSKTNSSRTPSRAPTDREQSSSPFTYTYVRAEQPATLRHPSDPTISRPTSVAESLSARNGGSPASIGDPFQYMTAGARTSYHAAAGSVRNMEVDDIYASYGSGTAGGPSQRLSGNPRDGSSSNEDDDRGNGVRVTSASGTRPRHRDSADSRREPAPEPRASRDRTPPPVKKSSVGQSPVNKRKSVSGSTRSSGRRKGK